MKATSAPASAAAAVRDFHVSFGYPIGACPAVPSDELKELRVRLLKDEVEEVVEAIDEDDLAGVAQELADVVYVAYGTALTYGIDLDAVIAEVHRANMTKEPGTSGKAVKGSGFMPADVAAVLGLGAKPVADDHFNTVRGMSLSGWEHGGEEPGLPSGVHPSSAPGSELGSFPYRGVSNA